MRDGEFVGGEKGGRGPRTAGRSRCGRPASESRPYNGVRKFKEERSRFPFGFVEERVVYFG